MAVHADGITLETLASYAVDKFEEFKQARTDKEEIWTECIRMYLSKFSPEVQAWLVANSRSRRYIAAPWDAVETVKSQVMAQMFPADQWIGIIPGEPGGWDDDDLAAKHIKALLYDQFRKNRFRTSWGRHIVPQLLICGSAPFTSSWDVQHAVDYPSYATAMQNYDQQNKQEWAEYQQMVLEYQEMARAAIESGMDPSEIPPPPQFRVPGPPIADTKIAYQGPVIECDDLFNFVIDPFPDRVAGALRIKKTWKSRAYLERFAKPDETGYRVYENLENVHDIDIRSSRAVTDSQLIERASAFGLDIPNKTRGVELLEAQGDMEIPHAQAGRSIYLNYTLTVANSLTVIRFEPGFLWLGEPSTQLATICAPPGEVYGTGILEPNRGTNELMQVRTNQLVDAVAAILNPEYKAVYDGIIAKKATSRPGKIHWVGNMKNFEALSKDFRGVQIGMQDYAMLKAEFQQGTRSANPSIPSYQRSATEIQRDAGLTGATLNDIVQQIEDTALTKAVEHAVCMNGMFNSETVWAHATQNGVQSWLPVSPEMIRRNWLVHVMGSQHVAERAQRIQDMMFFENMAAGNPVLAPFVRHLQMLKKIWAEMGFQDGSEIFTDESTGTNLLIEMMMNGTLMGMKGAQGAQNPGGGPASGQQPTEPGPRGGIGGDSQADAGPGFSDDPRIPGEGLLGALQGLKA